MLRFLASVSWTSHTQCMLLPCRGWGVRWLRAQKKADGKKTAGGKDSNKRKVKAQDVEDVSLEAELGGKQPVLSAEEYLTATKILDTNVYDMLESLPLTEEEATPEHILRKAYQKKAKERERARQRKKVEQLHGKNANYVLKRMEMKQRLDGAHWNPKKKLSIEKMDELRGLRERNPKKYTLKVLSKTFGISTEAVSRILHSKWRTNRKEN